MRKWIYALLIVLFASLFYLFDTFYIIENNLTDRMIRSTQETDAGPDPRIVLLGIDEESMEEVGQWPWPREVMAGAVEKLTKNGAEAVFVDVLYTEKSQNSKEDEKWKELAGTYNNIYLPVYFQFQSRQRSQNQLAYETMREPVFGFDRSQKGHINFLEGRDRVVRRLLLGVPGEDGTMMPAMSVRLANRILSEENQVTWDTEGNWKIGDESLPVNERGEVHFRYTSAPQQQNEGFTYFSMKTLLNEEIDPLYFENAIVLIGPYTVGIQDMYYTPMSQSLRMYGVEIHANALQSLLDRAFYQPISKAGGLLLITVLTVLSYAVMDRLKAKWASFVFVGLLVGYTVLSYVIFETMQLLLPYFYPLMALVLAYVSTVILQYVREQTERRRVTSIFGRYVSKGVVDEILSSQEEIQLGGIRRDVTLVFVDIRGFTTLSEQIEPEEVIQILNEYLDLCTQAVFEFEGTLDKFIGDGVMAIFGAPVSQEDHAQRAIRSALRMKEKAGELAERLEREYGRSVQFGVGINSGPAVIGNIGSEDRLDYTAIGDNVNLAARLESVAKPGQVLISSHTYEKVRDDFKVTPLEEIKVKGKEKPVMIYQVEEELQ